MTKVTNNTWKKYDRAINDAHYIFNQAKMIWKRYKGSLNIYHEDEDQPDDLRYDTIELDTLNYYNAFRTWPITQDTITGSLDKQSMIMILNKKYLGELGYLNQNGNFDFDPDMDLFYYKGQKYVASGDTMVSQAKDTDLLIYIILKRQPIETGLPQR